MGAIQDRVLVMIETVANTAGIEKAQAGFAGLNLSTLALGAALGGLVMAGKSMIDIAEQQAKSQLNLAQAVKESGGNLNTTNAYIGDFVKKNRDYVASTSEVQDAYGALVRSGVPAAEAQLDLNRATDLAALKNISLTDATALLVAAEHGRTRGLIDLGITTTKYTDSAGNVINQGKNMALVMKEIDDKTKGGRDTLTETQKISNRLSNDWQDLSKNGGPVLLTLLDAVISKVDDLYKWFDKIGKDDKLWSQISDRLVDMASWLKTYVVDPIKEANYQLQNLGGGAGGQATTGPGGRYGYGQPGFAAAPPSSGRASGGPVSAGQSYLVGERGPEMFTPGQSGGITPHGTGSVTINMNGIYAGDGPSLDRLANMIALRLGYASGR